MKNFSCKVNGIKVCIIPNVKNETMAFNKFTDYIKEFTSREQKTVFGAVADEMYNVELIEESSDIILI